MLVNGTVVAAFSGVPTRCASVGLNRRWFVTANVSSSSLVALCTCEGEWSVWALLVSITVLCTSVCSRTHVCVCVCVHGWVGARVCVCARARGCSCGCVRVHMCVCVCVYVGVR